MWDKGREKTRIKKVLGFFLSFLHVLNILNGDVALNVSLVDMILVVLTISLTIFPLLLRSEEHTSELQSP